MGYGARRPLGSTATTALVSVGANAIVPGSGPIVAVGISVLNSLFGGNQDAVRQARVDWFTQGATQGSTWAARVMQAAPFNTGSNEARQWQAAYPKAQSTQAGQLAWQQAELLGPYWDSTDDATSSKMRALVENELTKLRSSSVVPGGQTLPGMTTTAPYNWLPVLLLGGVGVAAFLYARKR